MGKSTVFKRKKCLNSSQFNFQYKIKPGTSMHQEVWLGNARWNVVSGSEKLSPWKPKGCPKKKPQNYSEVLNRKREYTS